MIYAVLGLVIIALVYHVIKLSIENGELKDELYVCKQHLDQGL